MYEIIKADVSEKDKIKKMIDLAKNYSYRGLVLSSTNPERFKEYKNFIRNLESKLDLATSIIIKEKSVSKLKSKISNFRSKVDFLIVEGSNEEINRFAVQDKRIDLLYNYSKIQNIGLNHVLAKKSKQNSVAIGFNLKNLLKRKGYVRARIMNNQIKNQEIVKKYDSPFVLSCFPDNKFLFKRKRELTKIVKLLDFEKIDLEKSNDLIEDKIDFNRKFDKKSFIEPGVEKVEEPDTFDEE